MRGRSKCEAVVVLDLVVPLGTTAEPEGLYSWNLREEKKMIGQSWDIHNSVSREAGERNLALPEAKLHVVL